MLYCRCSYYYPPPFEHLKYKLFQTPAWGDGWQPMRVKVFDVREAAKRFSNGPTTKALTPPEFFFQLQSFGQLKKNF